MTAPRRFPVRRSIAALLCAQFLLASCSAVAQGLWPLPKPQPHPQPVPAARNQPDFQAPSATHCARPVSTREIPGSPAPAWQGRARDELARGAPERAARGDAAPATGSGRAVPTPPPAAAVAPGSMSAPGLHAQREAAPGSHDFAPPRQQPPAQRHGPVTAGVVDDNADFDAYLAFRDRTRVEHRARDVRERYLLEVKDVRGRAVPDAEVLVQGTSGHAMWARTDTGGRAWLHPDAFDPARSGHYEVLVRKDALQAAGFLRRGQKSAVEVVLEAQAAQQRARLDLVFLIDATGSMADEIDKLKSTLRTITGEVASLPSRPDICLALVAYRDRGDPFVVRSHDFTNDVGAFLQHALYPLQAAGGGDYPEAMNEALHETVHELSWRGSGTTRMVILLADAPPHLDYGAPHYDDDMLAALGKGIKVFGVGASGLDRQGEFIQRQIAQYTGGKFVFLTYADARRPGSGPGRETVHDVKDYSVDTLDRLVVRLVTEELAKGSPAPR
jgi:Mg-chelatase subunit ChlD